MINYWDVIRITLSLPRSCPQKWTHVLITLLYSCNFYPPPPPPTAAIYTTHIWNNFRVSVSLLTNLNFPFRPWFSSCLETPSFGITPKSKFRTIKNPKPIRTSSPKFRRTSPIARILQIWVIFSRTAKPGNENVSVLRTDSEIDQILFEFSKNSPNFEEYFCDSRINNTPLNIVKQSPTKFFKRTTSFSIFGSDISLSSWAKKKNNFNHQRPKHNSSNVHLANIAAGKNYFRLFWKKKKKMVGIR